MQYEQQWGEVDRVAALVFEKKISDFKQLVFSAREYEGIRQTLQEIADILGQHKYVSVELPPANDDEAASPRIVHFIRNNRESRVSSGAEEVLTVRVTTKDKERRCTSLECGVSFVDGDPVAKDSAQASLELPDSYISRVKDFLKLTFARPVCLEVSTQGYHELGDDLVMGLVDTGGQDKYVNKLSEAQAAQGMTVVQINRAGPPHPTHQYIRTGLHVRADHVHLMFVQDDNPNKFVVKEKMFGEFDFRPEINAMARHDTGRPAILAKATVNHLKHLGIRPAMLVGHYVDGIETAQRIRDFYNGRCADLQKIPPGRTFGVVHSTGHLKELKLRRAGVQISDDLNIENRKETEGVVFRDADTKLISVSNEITDSLIAFYSAKRDSLGFQPAGVDPNQFSPRAPGVSRDDPIYSDFWQQLAQLSRDNDPEGRGFTVEELQGMKMVYEVGRPIFTKGKHVSLQAFQHLLEVHSERDVFFAINIPRMDSREMEDLARRDPDSPDLKYILDLNRQIDQSGLGKYIIRKPSFTEEEIAKLGQLSHVLVTAATMETWGMVVQEAAMSGVAIISSNAVPIASEVLRGNDVIEVGPIEEKKVYKFEIGKGVVLVDGNAPHTMACAMEHLLYPTELNSGRPEDLRKRLGESAYRKVCQRTWEAIALDMGKRAGFDYNTDATGNTIVV